MVNMHFSLVNAFLPCVIIITLLASSANSFYTLHERREAHLKTRRLAFAHENYDPDYHHGPAHQARDLDELILRMYRREAINRDFYKKTGVIKDQPGATKRCKGSICTPEEMKKIIAEDKKKYVCPIHLLPSAAVTL